MFELKHYCLLLDALLVLFGVQLFTFYWGHCCSHPSNQWKMGRAGRKRRIHSENKGNFHFHKHYGSCNSLHYYDFASIFWLKVYLLICEQEHQQQEEDLKAKEAELMRGNPLININNSSSFSVKRRWFFRFN